MIKRLIYIISHISVEQYFLVVLSICFFTRLPPILRTDNKYVHQLNSMEELEQSLDNCWPDKDTQNSTQKTLSSFGCPVDHDRLQLFDNDEIDLNPSLNYAHIKHGGHYRVFGCKSRQNVAIVIPYRNREAHLERFSLYIHRFLPDQLVDYSVYVIEQTEHKKFNRAKLFNVGVKEILKLNPSICCFIFHDVDLIPLDQRNLYMCSNLPRHMSVGVSSLRYKLLYPELFGGVVAISKNQFEQIGGFSNDYYGWGGEDDDMFLRVISAGLWIQRTPSEFGLYNAMFHPKNNPNPDRHDLLDDSKKSYDHNSTSAISYELVNIIESALYTTILVNV